MFGINVWDEIFRLKLIDFLKTNYNFYWLFKKKQKLIWKTYVHTWEPNTNLVPPLSLLLKKTSYIFFSSIIVWFWDDDLAVKSNII